MKTPKVLLVFIASIIMHISAHGQAALLVLIFGDQIATEKFHTSIEGGLNVASLPGLPGQQPVYGINFGLGTFIKFNNKWALTPEFKPLSPRGAKSVLPINDYSSVLNNVSYGIALNYIDIPVLLRYNFTPTLFLATGPQLSILTSADQLAEGTLPLSGNSVSLNESVKSTTFHSVYWSVPVEIGYSLSTQRGGKGIDIKLRYNFGCTDMIKAHSYGSSYGSTFQAILAFPFVNIPEQH